jgi:hypothetical protein
MAIQIAIDPKAAPTDDLLSNNVIFMFLTPFVSFVVYLDIPDVCDSMMSGSCWRTGIVLNRAFSDAPVMPSNFVG